jgi:hypothetical protein
VGQLERAAQFERGDTPAEKLAKLEMLLVQSAVVIELLRRRSRAQNLDGTRMGHWQILKM